MVRPAMRDLLSIRHSAPLPAWIRSLAIPCALVSLSIAVLAEPTDANSATPAARRRPIAELPIPSAPAAGAAAEESRVRSLDGIPELTFRDLFRASPGAGGLETTERARALDGKAVTLRGYMVRQSQPIPWAFILSPVPQSLHEREYGECDDLPVTAIHVFLPRSSSPIPTRLNGVVTVTGVLELGGHEEADGRVSPARIRINGPVSTGLVPASASRASSAGAL